MQSHSVPTHKAPPVQQSKSSEPSPGLTRNPDSPSGAFGVAPVQAQMAPTSVVQRKPSTEVPDLDEAVVEKINKALAEGKKATALSIMLDALAKKDPVKYDKTKLVGGKMHITYGNAETSRGPKFKAWLEDMLKKGPAEIKKGDAEMQKYLNTLTPPADKQDFKVEIGDGFFNNASHLYSTVRHEFMHVDQMRAKPMEVIVSSEWPSGFTKPSHKSELNAREFEAYSWEADSLANTGLGGNPDDTWNLFKQLASHGPKRSNADDIKKWNARLDNLFQLTFGKYLATAEALLKGVAAKPLNEADHKKVDDAYQRMERLWRYPEYRTKFETKFKTRYEAVEKYIKDKEAEKNAAAFMGKLKAAEKKMKGASSDWDGYNIWRPIYDDWIALPASAQKKFEAEVKKILPGMWVKGFDLLEKDLVAMWKVDKNDRNIINEWNGMSRMISRGKKSFVDDATWKARKAKLDEWDKKIEDNRRKK